MIDYVIGRCNNPLDDVKIDLGKDMPLYKYVIKAIKELEIINLLRLNPIPNSNVDSYPFVYIGNFHWNPHPHPNQLQTRRRETGTKVQTKSIADVRIGSLDFDILYGARDKNKILEQRIEHNTIYIPIADSQGRYLLDNVLYMEYQLVDKFLYPSGKNSVTLKSLLPIVVKKSEKTVKSIDGYLVDATKVMDVKIFKTFEPIITCFMHVKAPLLYLGVYPILQFCDHISDDKGFFEYFKPINDVDDIYIKAYRKGLEKFDYVRSILVMAMDMIKEYHPNDIDELRDPEWWVYQLSYSPNNEIEHRGACHEMHVARMLDTISAWVLPIPENDKKNMISLLRYVLQTEFTDMNIYSFENKRLRLNEVISTIVTAEVSEKLKKMFKFGILEKTKDAESVMKFSPTMIIKKIHSLGTIHVIEHTNDMDYYQSLKCTRKGPNALGHIDQHKIKFRHKQLHPSMIGKIDLLESAKDVGQTYMLSPYADLSDLNNADINKYPNIKYDLFKFIQEEFAELSAVTFDCDNIVDYNKILDKLCCESIITLDHYIPDMLGKSDLIKSLRG